MPYLLFENNNCEIERINQEKLKKIFNSKDLMKIDKEILKNITLFISTPLSEDVFEMFKNFKFKNIIVQHTTLANIDFISELNEQLYRNIIELNKPISEAFEIAKIDSENILHQFCCCFHKHKNNCKLKMNLSKELYFSQNNTNEDINEIPHFYHLRYKCNCSDKDFCYHKKNCDNYKLQFNTKKKKTNNICCCDLKIHDINHIFFCKFSEIKSEEGIFSNYQSNNFCTIINSDFVPNYDKMGLIIGRNFIVYNIFDTLLSNNYHIINVYGKEYSKSINKIDLLIDMIIEFLKERIPYMVFDDFVLNSNNEQSSDLSLIKKNTSKIKINKSQLIKDKYTSFDSNKINSYYFSAESAPQTTNKINSIPIFEKIYFKVDEQENNIRIINDIKNCGNKIYFINGFKISKDELINIFKQKELFKSRIILFTENKFDKEDIVNSDDIKR